MAVSWEGTEQVYAESKKLNAFLRKHIVIERKWLKGLKTLNSIITDNYEIASGCAIKFKKFSCAFTVNLHLHSSAFISLKRVSMHLFCCGLKKQTYFAILSHTSLSNKIYGKNLIAFLCQ